MLQGLKNVEITDTFMGKKFTGHDYGENVFRM